MSKILLEVDGVGQVEVDAAFEGLPPAEQQSVLREIVASAGAQTPQAPAEPAEPAEQSWGDWAGRKAKIATQAVGEGVANLAGLPADLGHLAYDGMGWVAERAYNNTVDPLAEVVLGTDLPDLEISPASTYTGGAGTSSQIKDAASALAGAAGYEGIARKDMTTSEKVGSSLIEGASSGLGTGKALSVVANSGKAAPAVQRILKSFVDNPRKAIAAEVAMSAGGQLGADSAPDNVVGQIAGGIAGSLAGGAALRAVTDGPAAVRNVASRANPVREIEGASNDTVYQTRKALRDLVTNPQVAAEQIDASADAARRTEGPMPSAGAASGDVGLMMLEKGYRQKGTEAARYVAQDEAIRGHGEAMVGGLRDADTSVAGAVQDAALRRRDETVGAAQRQLDETDLALLAAQDTAVSNAAPVRAVANKGAQQEASIALDDAVVTRGLMEKTREKNNLYSEIDPGWKVVADTTGIEKVVGDLGDSLNPLLRESEQTSSYAGAFLRRLQQREAGSATDAPVDISVGELAELAPRLKAEADALRTSAIPNVPKLDAINKIRRAVTDTLNNSADPAARKANEYYKTEFAPLARAGDKAQRLQKDVVKGMQGGQRGAFPDPANTAKYLTETPEDVASLKKLVASSSTRADAERAVTDFAASRFAQGSITKDGTVSFESGRRFMADNKALLDEFPAARAKIEADLKTAQLSADEIATARTAKTESKNLLDAEKDNFARSTASRMIGGEGAGAGHVIEQVKKIMQPGNRAAPERLAELKALVASDPNASRGLRSAVSEALYDSLRLSGGGSNSALTPGKVTRFIEDNRASLASVFDADQMKVVDDLVETMRPLSNIESARGGVVGSQTAANVDLKDMMRSFFYLRSGNSISAAANSKMMSVYGGMIGLDKLAAGYRVDRFLERAMLDPEVMSKVLKGVDPKAADPTPMRYLDRAGAQGIQAGAREYNEDDEMAEAFR